MIVNDRLPIYIINLKKRTDRLQSIQREFKQRTNFIVNIVEAIENSNGAFGLWQTIRSIILGLGSLEFVIICEDDHMFTNSYSPQFLRSCIKEAQSKEADVLLGGVSWFSEAIQISDHLFSVETFSATQFLVVYKRFFNKIIDANFGPNDSADYKIASLSDKKFIIYPFISVQKEFGYSDATSKNNQFGRVTSIFNSSFQRMRLLNKAWNFYHLRKNSTRNALSSTSIVDRPISTYILKSSTGGQSNEDIDKQFVDKPEYFPTLVDIDQNDLNFYGIGYFIQEIIRISIINEEDFIIICNHNHQFTFNYSREHLIRNLFYAKTIGTKILSGGTMQFGSAVAVSESLYWIDWFTNSPYIVLFKSVFNEILRLTNLKQMPLSMLYNTLSSNKLLFYPFISKQCDLDTNSKTALDTCSRLNFIRNEHIKYFGSNQPLPNSLQMENA